MNNNTLFIKAEEIAEELGISKAFAYKLIRTLNTELSKKGFLTISGRVSRAYFQKKVYGAGMISAEEVRNGSI